MTFTQEQEQQIQAAAQQLLSKTINQADDNRSYRFRQQLKVYGEKPAESWQDSVIGANFLVTFYELNPVILLGYFHFGVVDSLEKLVNLDFSELNGQNSEEDKDHQAEFLFLSTLGALLREQALQKNQNKPSE